MNTAHRLADGFRAVVSYWTPTPTTSQFVDKGTLTPQEFIEAGDQLTFKFPTWKWLAVKQIVLSMLYDCLLLGKRRIHVVGFHGSLLTNNILSHMECHAEIASEIWMPQLLNL